MCSVVSQQQVERRVFNILDECGVSVMHYVVLINMQYTALICHFSNTVFVYMCALQTLSSSTTLLEYASDYCPTMPGPFSWIEYYCK